MKIYTIRQVAEICHCHHSTILEHIHSGSLNMGCFFVNPIKEIVMKMRSFYERSEVKTEFKTTRKKIVKSSMGKANNYGK
ncbi:MAG: hypothetical protein IJR46_03795 [Neisseriaceae bacterium]|nr:hypothetical protein [Neisseriaceae bacterium]